MSGPAIWPPVCHWRKNPSRYGFVNATRPAGEVSRALSIEPYGQSGIGEEMGQAGLEAYLRHQVMWFNHG